MGVQNDTLDTGKMISGNGISRWAMLDVTSGISNGFIWDSWACTICWDIVMESGMNIILQMLERKNALGTKDCRCCATTPCWSVYLLAQERIAHSERWHYWQMQWLSLYYSPSHCMWLWVSWHHPHWWLWKLQSFKHWQWGLHSLQPHHWSWSCSRC